MCGGRYHARSVRYHISLLERRAMMLLLKLLLGGMSLLDCRLLLQLNIRRDVCVGS